MTMDLFAGIPIRDYAAAVSWYEQLLGAAPSFLPNDTEAVWELADHRYEFIEVRPEHAGHRHAHPLRRRLRRPHLPDRRAGPGAGRVRDLRQRRPQGHLPRPGRQRDRIRRRASLTKADDFRQFRGVDLRSARSTHGV